MTQPQVEMVLDARNAVGESPVWSAAEQALYWVDIPARALNRWTLATQALATWKAPEMLGCVAPMASGGWIAGAETGILASQLEDDGQLSFKRLVTVDHAQPGMRFNDGRCDRQGRFLAGTMLMEMASSLGEGCVYSYQFSSNGAGQLVKLLDGFKTPNGLAFSPDGRTMYLVAAARDIAALDGVDCLFVGPSDLAAGMGHLGNANHPDVQAAIASVFADAKAAGKPSGILAPVEADARKYMAMGATFVAVGSDLGAFRTATQALCHKYRD